MGSPTLHDELLRKTLARNLKALLEHATLSQYALGQKANVSQKQINNIAEARTGCGVDALADISNVLAVPPWVLLYDHTPDVTNSIASLTVLVDAYARASERDREMIVAVARRAR